MHYGRQGTGKRGGIRVIYYWISQDCQIYMLAAYAKSKKINLTPDEIAALRELVRSCNDEKKTTRCSTTCRPA